MEVCHQFQMCGIECCLHPRCQEPPPPDPLLLQLLDRRGPDCRRQGTVVATPDLALSYSSTVLWLQGSSISPQPVTDHQGNLLMWNGDVFNREDFGEVEGEESDTSMLARQLFQASTDQEVLEVFGKVRGPWATVLLHSATSSLWFGRDYFGRSSLLQRWEGHQLRLASVAPVNLSYTEVPALGVFQLLLPSLRLVLHPWAGRQVEEQEKFSLSPLPLLAPVHMDQFSLVWQPEDLPEQEVFTNLLLRPRVAAAVAQLLSLLRTSVARRVVEHQPQRCKDCLPLPSCAHAAVSVLLSGGVDSTLLALLVAQALPSRPLDLVNVAFQQKDGGFEVPDRLTGREAVQVGGGDNIYVGPLGPEI